MTKFKFYSILVILFALLSCQEDALENENIYSTDNQFSDFSKSSDPYLKSGRLGSDSEDIMRNAILEFSDMLKELRVHDDAYKELFYLFQNTHYVDHYVGLEDLLNHETALIYEQVDTNLFTKGSFKTFFNNEMDRTPNLYVNLNHVLKNRMELADETDDDQKLSLFYEIARITLYAPNLINSETDGTFNDTDLFTIVPGVVDGDEGLGYQFNDDLNTWGDITANENTADNNFTIIIEPNFFCNQSPVPMLAETYTEGPCAMWAGGLVDPNIPTGNQYTGNCVDIEDGDYIRQVWIGHITVFKQYDNWISFTGNGGGSELQFTRTDSREHVEDLPNDSNVDVFEFDERVEVYVTRYAINKKRERWYSIFWDFNWECATPTHEQLLLIYEKDNTSPIDFDFSGIEWQGETYGSVSLEAEVRTKNEIIRTWNRDGAEFFATNMLNDNGCSCVNGKNSFSDRCWPRYDCGANVRYTMPHRWVPAN